MKSIFSFTAMSLAVLFTFSGCTLFDPDLKVAKQLEGEWEVTSFTVDGVETMGALYNRILAEFEKYSDGEGDFNFTFTDLLGGTSSLFGEYVIDEDGSNLELTYSGGAVENWNIDLDKDDLDLDTVLDGTNYAMKAERN